jgi:ribulose-5-phosphate 4-epimerase/fuculose-1-phosphate aldolase
MNDAEYLVRKEIIATGLAMEKKGINQGTSGTVISRTGLNSWVIIEIPASSDSFGAWKSRSLPL